MLGWKLFVKEFAFNAYTVKYESLFRWRRVSIRGKARKMSRKTKIVIFKIGKTNRTLYNNFNLITKKVSKYAYLALVKRGICGYRDVMVNCVFISVYGVLGIFIKLGKKIFKRGKLSTFR